MSFRVMAAAAAVIVLVFARWPERWLRLPREHTLLWIMVLVAYPWVSVYPQELIYRRYFIFRYNDLFGGTVAAAWASAIAFGFMHVMFRNVTAPVLATIGGVLFARTYVRTGSLLLTCVEHAM